MKAAFRKTFALLAVLLPAVSNAQGWHDDGRGTSTWSVAPSEGQCNISQAKNRARRAGIDRTDLVYRDENTLVLRGLTQWGERRDIAFANVRGCPEIGFQDVQPMQPQPQTQMPPSPQRR